MENVSRYNNESSSSHNTGGFSKGNYRNSLNDSGRPMNQNSSFGAQFKNPPENENGGGDPACYSTWQNMNASSGNTWNDGGKATQHRGRGILGGRTDVPAKDDKMMVDGESNSYSGLLGATGGSESFPDDKSNPSSSFNGPRPAQMPRMGLLGGGESSMVPPPSTWSGNQSSNNGSWVNRQGSNSENENPNAGTPANKPHGSWAQAAGKGLSPGSLNSGNPTGTSTEAAPSSNEPAPPNGKEQIDPVVTDLRVKAAYSTGWGQEKINQDTAWNVDDPLSLEEGKGDVATAMWRAPVNNGTENWAANLRNQKENHGVPDINMAAASVNTKIPPWGHTPVSNIGGHWGEDEPHDSWNGAPPPDRYPNSNPNMWGQPTANEKHWNSNPTSWGGDAPCAPDNSSWPGRQRQLGNWSPAATPKKEMPPTGWEPPSPPPIRRPVGSSYDDGTATWGNPRSQGKVSHWKDMPSAKPIMNSGVMMPPTGPGMIRLPMTGKNDGTMSWNKPPPTLNRGASNWQDMPPRDSPTIGSWNDENQAKNMQQMGQYGGMSWNDQNNQGWNSKPKSASNWADGQVDTSSWLGPAKQGGKPLCKDIVHSSKHFRILTEWGYRKEDVENALINSKMNFEEACAELQSIHPLPMDVDNFQGRKVRPANMYDDLSISDHNMEPFGQNMPNNNFQNFPGGHNFKQPTPKGLNNNLMNTMLGGQPLNGANLTPALIQKLLQQQQQQQQLLNLNNVQSLGGNQKFNANSQQLKHLVQQIQMAVAAGHLNAQILNQNLSPTTLNFLYQLLQQIKVLGTLHQQLLQNTHLSKGVNNPATMQLNMQIQTTKSRIANLQNQISVQQALFQKQQQLAQQPPPLNSHSTADIFKTNMDTMPNLHSDFRDLNIKDMSHHQSRLNQWKLSSAEDAMMVGSSADLSSADFSRAPGPINSKPPTSLGHPLLEQGDSTWRSHGESAWPDTTSAPDTANSGSGNGQSTDGKEGAASSYNLTDLVPEFEPGKPWKGTQLKNIEDDPHITPGSIAKSPLSVNSIKDSNLFWPSKASPANSDVSGLSSNTWGYSSQSAIGANSPTGNLKSGKTGWNPEFGSEPWGSMGGGKSRNSSTTQGWDRQYSSTFLILKNLTPQIDGSTLKTLCMQHGPLQMFHLYLSRGVALVRYATREEAAKAQSALDNCVLSNTTMLADFPSDSEIQQYLQVSSGQTGGAGTTSTANNTWPSTPSSATAAAGTSSFYGNSGNGSSNWNANTAAPTSQLWSFSNSSLWGSGQSSTDHDASTNPINYLPNDLLGGEPM